MASKTDIWMPLYIGDYLAATSHLSALESGAYLHLLMHQWKNGQLPSDLEALRRIARVDKDAWSNAWAMLKTFFDDATGAPIQHRLETIRDEWNEKKVKSQGKAKAAAEARWGKDAPSNAQAMPQRCPSSSSSSTPKEKQKPSRDKREGDPRHQPFKEAIEKYASFKGVVLPWDGSEAKALALLLKSLPAMTLIEFQACLNNRARSPGTPHGERPRVWIPHIGKFQEGPLNEFGKTGEASNGKFAGKTESSINAAQQAIDIIRARGQAERDRGDSDEVGYPAPSEAGHGRLLGAG